jgi:hypothetical protein
MQIDNRDESADFFGGTRMTHYSLSRNATRNLD